MLRTALCDLLGIHDLPGAGEVVQAIVREAAAVLAALPRRVRVTGLADV